MDQRGDATVCRDENEAEKKPTSDTEQRDAGQRDSQTDSRASEAPCRAYLSGDPMREVGGVGLLPALCRRRTACRRNVLRSRRKMTVSSLPGAVAARHIIGQSDRALQDKNSC